MCVVLVFIPIDENSKWGLALARLIFLIPEKNDYDKFKVGFMILALS